MYKMREDEIIHHHLLDRRWLNSNAHKHTHTRNNRCKITEIKINEANRKIIKKWEKKKRNEMDSARVQFGVTQFIICYDLRPHTVPPQIDVFCLEIVSRISYIRASVCLAHGLEEAYVYSIIKINYYFVYTCSSTVRQLTDAMSAK